MSSFNFRSQIKKPVIGIEQAARYGNTVVIIQYRLGVLGFMNSFNVETGLTVGGNYGLHDQLMAIRFIFENKSNLGCSRITLNGESAGAASGLTP